MWWSNVIVVDLEKCGDSVKSESLKPKVSQECSEGGGFVLEEYEWTVTKQDKLQVRQKLFLVSSGWNKGKCFCLAQECTWRFLWVDKTVLDQRQRFPSKFIHISLPIRNWRAQRGENSVNKAMKRISRRFSRTWKRKKRRQRKKILLEGVCQRVKRIEWKHLLCVCTGNITLLDR